MEMGGWSEVKISGRTRWVFVSFETVTQFGK